MIATKPQSLKELALGILGKRDTVWDSSETVSKKGSQGAKSAGTVNSESNQRFNLTVPLPTP
jgi:hypothetical protein